MAKNAGKQFEKDWQDSCHKHNVYIDRYKDSANWGKGFQNTASKNPCDFVMYKKPNLFLLEMKSTEGTSFSFDEKIIKKHQIESLENANKYDGIIAGFLFNFRYRKTIKTERPNAVYFVPIKEFISFKESTDKSSINEADCQRIGFIVDGNIKITHFSYDVTKFIMDCVERKLDNES